MIASLMKVLVLTTLLVCNVTSTETNPSANSTQMEPKIVGGLPIVVGQAPYMVSVRLTANDRVSYGSGHLCGGVVISQRLVATAAHCCFNSRTPYKAGDYVLVMGGTYLRTKDPGTLQYYVQQLLVHNLYRPGYVDNDIALMFINGYIPWSSRTVKALPLNRVSLPAGTVCAISGWGLLREGAQTISNQLQQANVPVISNAQCKVTYGSIPDSQMCAGYMQGGIDSCQGDSGGPLRCNNQLAGLTSYGSGCARPNYPGVYTNISSFYSWIVQKNNSLDYSVYRNAGERLGGIYGICLMLVAILVAGQLN